MLGETAVKEIEKKRSELDELSRKIWENPEVGFKEYKAQENVVALLEKEGFQVETGVGGVPTAVMASYGEGHPVIAFLGEFDALPGLNQKVSTKKEAFQEGALYGHGCGHNLLCTAHVGAVIGLKKEMEEKGLKGTIRYYACPGEELLTGKGLMARGGAFEGVDTAINFHPNKVSEATIGVSTAVNSAKFHFYGKSAHASNCPERGRSALDAVELMDVGSNFLREHVPSDVRIHYIITEGGIVPNVVPDKACVWYYVRAFDRETVEDIYARLVNIAKGAALMTDTQVEVEFLGGCYNTMNNKVLADVQVHGVGQELGGHPVGADLVQGLHHLFDGMGRNAAFAGDLRRAAAVVDDKAGGGQGLELRVPGDVHQGGLGLQQIGQMDVGNELVDGVLQQVLGGIDEIHVASGLQKSRHDGGQTGDGIVDVAVFV